MKKTFNAPDSQEREYTRLLLAYVKRLEADSNKLLIPRLGDIKREFEREARADGWLDTLDQIMSQLALLALQSFGFVETKLVGQYEAVSKFNNGQFKLVVKANTGLDLPPVMPGAPKSVLLGVDVFRSEPFLKPLMDGWVKENSALIKSLPTKLHPDMEGIIRRGVVNGASVKQLSDEIKKKYQVTEYRAKLIAQDQINKANADLTRYRLQSVGVKQFEWDTVGDSRVRPEHSALSGKVFSWDKPHPTEGLPGSRPRCRCRASALWPDD
jgi:SPP1 gp7 family putative phage head morphogenesis protein